MTKKTPLSAKFVFVYQENKKLAQKTHLANFHLSLVGQIHLARSCPRAEKTEKIFGWAHGHSAQSQCLIDKSMCSPCFNSCLIVFQ